MVMEFSHWQPNESVILTISGAASNENLVKWLYFHYSEGIDLQSNL